MTMLLHDRMIADSAQDFLERIGGLARARRLRESGAFDRGAWDEMARLGWFGLLVTEENGGLGLSGRELTVLMEMLGRYLAAEPVGETIAAAAAVASAPNAASLMDEILSGAAIVVPVWTPFEIQNGRLAGVAGPAANLAHATHLLIERAGSPSRLVVVPREASGVSLETFRTVDGGSASRLALDLDLRGALALSVPDSSSEMAALRAVKQIAYAAYLVGLADAAFGMALDHLKTRKQFGVPIGSFQALQHRAATVYVRIAAARALVAEAGMALGSERAVSAAAAAALTAHETVLYAAKEAIQFHGAIGFTDEHVIGLFLKRAMAVGAALGTADECLDRYRARGAANSVKISSAA